MARMIGDAAYHVLPGASHTTIWKLLKRSTTGVVICLPPEAHNFTDSAPHLPSCGKPLSKAEIKVVDTDAVEMQLGQLGEIIARSPQNMLGNWNLPEATAMTIRDGWLHTGDAGYVDADGYVYIHDRINDMIISRGERTCIQPRSKTYSSVIRRLRTPPSSACRMPTRARPSKPWLYGRPRVH
jgi:acyl-CoA synthetase (AMP-forming)/AMP-acid ligase II